MILAGSVIMSAMDQSHVTQKTLLYSGGWISDNRDFIPELKIADPENESLRMTTLSRN